MVGTCLASKKFQDINGRDIVGGDSIFFLLNCRNKSERIFARLFTAVAYSARDGRCLEKQRVSDAAVTIFDV